MNTKYTDLIDQTFDFPQEEFSVTNNQLSWHGINLSELIKEHGTPLKFSYLPKISENIQRAKIWFSDASQRFDIHAGFADIIESQSTGRIFSYDPRTQQTTLEMDGLAFANGVVLSPDEDFLLVNETYR